MRTRDYVPVSLGDARNVTANVVDMEIGAVGLDLSMRGLPFHLAAVSDDDPRCFVRAESTVRIPIGHPALHVVIAHRLLDPVEQAGHGVGSVVAEYIFRLADGRQMRVPIRERFEVQVIPTGWGRQPFLAVTDEADGNLPRFEGPWGEAGLRLTEHQQGSARNFYLWAWRNPAAGSVVEYLEIVPHGGRVLIGAITAGLADEYPFVRTGACAIAIEELSPQAVPEATPVSIEVDRGVATYPQPLAGTPARAGFGSPVASFTPAYAKVAALPSATLVVRRADEELGRVTWCDVQRDGQATGGLIRIRLLEPGRNWVHVKVLDHDTSQLLPCRIHFSGEGVPAQPHGHHQHAAQGLESWHYDVGGDVRLGSTTYAYIDGTCQGWLPRGDVIVDVARGFEYEPLRETVRIEPGQRELTLRLRRIAHMASQGWWSGDSHVHFLSTPGSLLEQQGEDVHVVNLLQSQWGALFTNTEDFTGMPVTTTDGQYVTFVGQENRQHMLGHLLLWGLRAPVMPWGTDGPPEAELGGSLDATMSDWADRAHAQGATVVIPHFPNPNGEPAVLVATGRADAVEVMAHDDDALLDYYRYLNCGYRLPLVGGTDKMSASVPIGLYRTYARLQPGEPFTYDAWCAAVRAGRTFLSGGPLLSFDVEGAEPGDTVQLARPGTVAVTVVADGIFPLDSVEIVCNGAVVGSQHGDGAKRVALTADVAVCGSAWVAARAFGTQNHLDKGERRVFAHSSPVYVACGGPWELADPAGLQYMMSLVEGARDYARHTASHRPSQLVTHHHGEADHLAWLERPFDEALAALSLRAAAAK